MKNEISEEQEEIIKEYIDKFKVWTNSEKGLEWKKDRKKREKLIKEKFSKENIDNLDLEDFKQILKNMWFMNIWTNKNFQVNRIIEENGFDKIKSNFKDLFYSDDSLEKRFDKFKKNVKYFAASAISEFLLFMYPENCCLWNDKPKNVLPFLKIDDLLPSSVFKYSLDGKKYEKCIEVLSIIKKLLRENGINNANFIDVDFFLAFIFYEILPSVPEKKIKNESEKNKSEKMKDIGLKDFDHETAEALLLKLGNLLGYKTYTADPSKKFQGIPLRKIATLERIPEDYIPSKRIKTVSRIDVIWFTKENMPEFCFEVEHTTDITKGLLRLYQTRYLQTKLFIISNKNNYPKFKREINRDPFYNSKNRYNFRSYENLLTWYEEAKKYFKIKNSFLTSQQEI